MLSGRKKKDYAAESSADGLELASMGSAAQPDDDEQDEAAAAADPIPEPVAA